MKYKLIIFDFDGTLADTFLWFLNSLDVVADTFDLIKIDRSRIAELRQLNAASFLKHLNIPLYKLPAISAFMRSRMKQQIEEITLFAGVEKMLKELKARGQQIAIVSTNSHENIEQVMGGELVNMTDHFVGGVSLFGKEIKLKKVLKQSGINREDAIYIGDELRDVQASQKIGLPCGAAAWGYNAAAALKALSPTFIFYKLDDILEKIS